MTSIINGRPKAPAAGPVIGENFRQVRGWGADLDPATRPAVPKEAPSDVTTPRGLVGARQVPKHKIYLSLEHPDMTPVFGTSTPPRLVSGLIRDAAFKFSEGRQAHWRLLVLADRINVIEGDLEDLARGRVPRYIRDKGWPALIKYDKSRQRSRDLMLAGIGLGLLVALVGWRRSD